MAEGPVDVVSWELIAVARRMDKLRSTVWREREGGRCNECGERRENNVGDSVDNEQSEFLQESKQKRRYFTIHRGNCKLHLQVQYIRWSLQ